MSSRHECSSCGLTAFDLPDDVDPDFVFEGGLCQGCAQMAPLSVKDTWW